MGGGKGKKGIIGEFKKQAVCREGARPGSKKVDVMEILSYSGLS